VSERCNRQFLICNVTIESINNVKTIDEAVTEDGDNCGDNNIGRSGNWSEIKREILEKKTNSIIKQ